MPEFPQELLDSGASGVVIIWFAWYVTNIIAKAVQARRNGNGHASAGDRAMMLTSLLRTGEEVKEKLSEMALAQAVHGEQTKQIVENQDRILDKIEDHDRRIRGVEIRQGGGKNAA
jgi:hypothetical protein